MAIIENHGQMSEVMENGDVNVFYPKTYASDVYIDNEGNNLDTLISQLFLRVHPVGCIYMTVDSTNPGTIYGGTWTSWGTGQVPVGVNTSDTSFNTVEKTGGEKTHTLTGDESGQKNLGTFNSNSSGSCTTGDNGWNHYHGVSGTTSTTGNHRHYTFQNHTSGNTEATSAMNGDYNWNATVGFWYGDNDWKNYKFAMSYGIGDAWCGGTSTEGNHYHSFSVNSGTANANHNHTVPNHTHSLTISASNATNAHNNLQPYITCYMFKRTA